MSDGQQSPDDQNSGRRLSSPGVVAAIPVVVLVAVFGLQYVAAHHTELSPWKGGGFGMFSTVDTGVNRIVEIRLEVDGREIPVEAPDELHDDIDTLEPMPTADRTDELAERLLAVDWVEVDDGLPPSIRPFAHRTEAATDRRLVPRTRLHDEDAVVKVDGVRILVWRRQFEADDQTGGGTLERTLVQQRFVAASDS